MIAACKRVHDHLHELRQNAIRPILESALIQWRAEGQLGVPVGILIGLKVGFAEAKVQNICPGKAKSGRQRRNLACGPGAGRGDDSASSIARANRPTWMTLREESDDFQPRCRQRLR